MTTTGDPPGSTPVRTRFGKLRSVTSGLSGILEQGSTWALGSDGGQLLLGRSRPVATQPLTDRQLAAAGLSAATPPPCRRAATAAIAGAPPPPLRSVGLCTMARESLR